MKYVLIVFIFSCGVNSWAANSVRSFEFTYSLPNKKSMKISQSADNKDLAFKLAARECFKKLTGGKYPGESKGLQIIDICANPKS